MAPESTAPGTNELVHSRRSTDDWWRSAVIYQIYPRSFADGDGDGVGDLRGIRDRLHHLRDLGVDAVWFSPFYRSPMNDAGYDVADYRDIDPIFGTLDDAQDMIDEAKALGLKVLIDLVPNHTSSEHEWFQQALAAAPGSPERDRYVFRDGRGADGSEPPNNWRSVFGGQAWSRVTEADGAPGQWYLHLFDVTQPDLNWRNADVHAEFDDILRFWLGRGVDGFRVDVAHGLAKEDGLPDADAPMEILAGMGERDAPADEPIAPMWDQDAVHDIYREWRRVVDEFPEPPRILCAEAWVEPPARLARYTRPDEMHQAFNFSFLETPWRAEDLRASIAMSYASSDAVEASPTWVLSNHDVVRHASRLGLPVGTPRPNGIGPDDPQPDPVLGLRRARAATMLMLALPGSAYLYQGEELGLPESTEVPDELRQDPTYLRTDHETLGRDGCRIPMPWERDAPALGFSATGATWLPQPAAYADLAVDQQAGDETSTLELYRTLLRVRRERALGTGSLSQLGGFGDGVLAYEVASDAATTRVLVNLGEEPVRIPSGATVLATSTPLIDTRVPQDAAVWLA